MNLWSHSSVEAGGVRFTRDLPESPNKVPVYFACARSSFALYCWSNGRANAIFTPPQRIIHGNTKRDEGEDGSLWNLLTNSSQMMIKPKNPQKTADKLSRDSRDRRDPNPPTTTNHPEEQFQSSHDKNRIHHNPPTARPQRLNISII